MLRNFMKFMTLLLILPYTLTASEQSVGEYYTQLKKKYSDIGSARFIGGSSPEGFLKNIKGGELLEVEGEGFSAAKKFNVDKKPRIYWQKVYSLKSDQAVKKGEAMLVVFWARGKKAPQFVDDGQGAVVQTYIHTDVGKYHKNRLTNFYQLDELGDKWKMFTIKTEHLPVDFPAGSLALRFMMGHKKQTIEIGGVAWMVFGKGADIAKMPQPDWNYPGRAADSPWRKEAQKRIEKYRKGDFTIVVKDSKGKPVRDAEVNVDMKKHAFGFGTAINFWAFHGNIGGMSEEDVQKFREYSTKYFNSVTTENCLKWHIYDKLRKKRLDDLKQMLKFYHDNGMRIRGHVLVWPSFYRLPNRLKKKLRSDKELLRKTVNEHIIEQVEYFKPWVTDWDVTNETKVNRTILDALGPQAMVEWYKLVRKTAPSITLTFNEISFGALGGMEVGSFPQKLLSKDCKGWVDYLIQNKAPLDYLGSQAHGGRVGKEFAGKVGPEGLWAYYDYLWKEYGKKLQLTELDVKIADRNDPLQVAYQNDKLRDSIIIAFSHPAFECISQWGFWEGRHYAPNAALWSKDWKLRPHGKTYLDLVYNKWWTKLNLKTDSKGRCSARGFYGDYQISVNGKPVKNVKLKKGTNEYVITLNK